VSRAAAHANRDLRATVPYANSTAWLRVDLGSVQRVSEITIAWEEQVAFARAYSLQCARDDGAAQWTQLFETASGAGGREVVGGLSADCRFVLLNCTQTGTTNGFSVYELEVQ
jgi:hexosaminidase